MPVYEYACMDCRKVVSLLVRSTDAVEEPACPDCAGADLRRLVSGFAFHRSLVSQLEQLDPKYDKMIGASSPDLSFDSLVRRYGLDRPTAKPED